MKKILILLSLMCAFFLIPTPAIAAETTISMTSNAFVPQEITINQGDTVTFVNNDKVDRWPASNIHPTHGIYPEFDPKRPTKPGESWQFTFDKAGTWKFHDHLLPHLRGTITVTGNAPQQKKNLLTIITDRLSQIKNILAKIFTISPKSSSSPKSPQTDFPTLPQPDQLKTLDAMITNRGLVATWKYVIDTYQSDGTNRNAHDLAHFIGQRIFEKKGIDGISICNPSFAFGCYHGITDTALAKNLEPLPKLAKACESVGKINSGPWASCIHGIGHGVATYFDTVKLRDALSACDTLTAGANYCHDGVFMEFVTNAPATVYKTRDPLYPCNALEEKYRQGCARNQPRVMQKYMSMDLAQISNLCLASNSKTIRNNCIDAIGLQVGQESNGNSQVIINSCSTMPDQAAVAQCVSAAAGELVFQNMQGWQTVAPAACNSLSQIFQQACRNRVNKTISDYGTK